LRLNRNDKNLKNINLPILSFILGIITLVLDIILYVEFYYSDRLMFTPWFAFVDYTSFVSMFFTWAFVGVAIVSGIKGLKDEKKKWAKYGIGLAVLGFLIYILLILSLYLRLG
jgi:hypothetical protein